MVDQLGQTIVQFVRDYHGRSGQAPSLRAILKHFRKDRLNFTRFYEIFPRGIVEVCRLSGIPVPDGRIEKTEKATRASKVREPKTAVGVGETFRLTLTEEQTKRLLGMSHLEAGKDPLVIIDELLERDSELRRLYKLSLSDTKLIADYLKTAIDRGWSISSGPNIVEFTTKLYNLRIHYLLPETVEGLIGLVRELREHKWDVPRFVKEATEAHNTVYLFRQYAAGQISAETAKQRLTS